MGKEAQPSEKKDWSVYKVKDTRPSCEQIAHLLRSIFWSPNHLKSKKVKTILKKLK